MSDAGYVYIKGKARPFVEYRYLRQHNGVFRLEVIVSGKKVRVHPRDVVRLPGGAQMPEKVEVEG
jgi:hypothetical protein